MKNSITILLILILSGFWIKPLFSKDSTSEISLLPGESHTPIHLQVIRQYKSETCNSGFLAIENQILVYTLERPDVVNLEDISAIPAGIYQAHIRTDEKDCWRIQLDNVPERTNVQIHIGTDVSDSTGCILVGMQTGKDLCSLSNSKAAYDKLKTYFNRINETKISGNKNLEVEIEDPSPLGLCGMNPVSAFDSLPQDVPTLIKMLETDDEYQRSKVMIALGLMKDLAKPAVPKIMTYLLEEDTRDKPYVYMALIQIGLENPEDKTKVIQEALKDFNFSGICAENDFLRGYAAITLGHFSQTKPTAHLLLDQLKRESSPFVFGKIIESLGELGPFNPEILPLLIQMANDNNYFKRSCALKAIGSMGPYGQSAQWAVQNNLSDSDRFIRQCAQEALNRMNFNLSIR